MGVGRHESESCSCLQSKCLTVKPSVAESQLKSPNFLQKEEDEWPHREQKCAMNESVPTEGGAHSVLAHEACNFNCANLPRTETNSAFMSKFLSHYITLLRL